MRWVETDDLDHDGLNNLQELLAGTDLADPNSVLAFERIPRPNDLVEADKTPIGADQHAWYFQSVPGRSYEIQMVEVLGGQWTTVSTVTASATQKRVALDNPARSAFYRILVVPFP